MTAFPNSIPAGTKTQLDSLNLSAGAIAYDSTEKSIRLFTGASTGGVRLIGINPRAFGAKGDGTTNDASAFQAAINYASSTGNVSPGTQKGCLVIPDGNYLISSGLDVYGLQNVVGTGIGACTITVNTSVGFSCGNSTSFSGISFTTSNNAYEAIKYASTAYLPKIDNCSFSGFGKAINFAGATTTKATMRSNFFTACVYGIYTSGIITATVVRDNNFNTITTAALRVDDGLNWSIGGNVFEDSAIGILISTQLGDSDLSGNWFEKLGAAYTCYSIKDSTASNQWFARNAIAGCRFVGVEVPDFGDKNTWIGGSTDGSKDGWLVSSRGNYGAKFIDNELRPYRDTCQAYTSPTSFGLRGQNADGTLAAVGGDVTAKPGTGSSGAASGNLVVADTAGNGGAWNKSHLVLGAFHIWVDSSSRLRIKNSAPTSDTDGTIVGTQS